jgi:hypothetical protein
MNSEGKALADKALAKIDPGDSSPLHRAIFVNDLKRDR